MNKVLYFPYIHVPEDEWTTKSVLYWDEVASIIPSTLFYDVKQQETVTSELLKADFLKTVYPDRFIYDRNKFQTEILEFINSDDFGIDERIENFGRGNKGPMYWIKFNIDLFQELGKIGLAEKRDNESFLVESHTANYLMFELANMVSISGEYTLSTDEIEYGNIDFIKELSFSKDEVRANLLEEILPYPVNPDYKKLIDFKVKYHDDLLKFRRKIELLTETLALIPKESRERVKELHIKYLKEEKDYLTAKLTESKVGKAAKGAWTGVAVSAGMSIATMNPVPLIGGAISGTVGGIKGVKRDDTKGRDMRYVALLEANKN